MAEKRLKDDYRDSDSKPSLAVSDFVKGLSQEQRMLVILKAQLYGRNWDSMIDDLQNRLAGKPYIFKLANRIQDDINRIKGLRDFEMTNNVDLADFIELQ